MLNIDPLDNMQR